MAEPSVNESYSEWEDFPQTVNLADTVIALHKRISAADTIDGRLSLLEDAASVERLKPAALQLTLELLLLGGRTEEAEAVLNSITDPVSVSYLKERLAMTHGLLPVPAATTEETVPGVSEASIQSRQSSLAGTPESYAHNRGMLISTGLLFSPYNELAVQEIVPQTESRSSDGAMVNIQVGAFSEKENADQHVAFLKGRGIAAGIIKEERPGGRIIYKTVVPVSESGEAQTELIRLKEMGIEGFILN